MAILQPKTSGRFVRWMRHVYHPIGFRKGYNFTLWFIFAGALFGFSLSRLQYLSFGIFCDPNSAGANGAAPGECYNYNKPGVERIGLILHLATILPAGILVVLQFVPTIRYKALLFHRINGYLILLLSIASTVGVFMLARHAFGGGIETQTVAGFMSILFICSLVLAYINIKRLQIEQHRAWMLRAWFYATAIITTRFIMPIGAAVVSGMGGFYQARPCGQIDDMFRGNKTMVLGRYPECADWYTGNTDRHAAVPAKLAGGGTRATTSAALGMNFGSAMWLALALHAIGVEIYLHLTPGEAERLRRVSYERQLKAGFKHPGRAGLTVDRLGDTDGRMWSPPGEVDDKRRVTSHEVASKSTSDVQGSSVMGNV